MFTVNNKGSYILIRFSGIVSESVLRSSVTNLSELLENENKNEIWSFDGCEPALTYNILFSIISSMRSSSKQEAKSSRTAIVAGRGLNPSLSSISSSWPGAKTFSIRIFRDYREAESWVR
ncbi:MAG: hypothetical protein HGB29_08085 [Chlorobiaceae bacterium]|nr:hypothetical protein [Chlorobiaceae bacterium]NTW74807.1 hypothetical protein [Chlorobiaceae bacterium]